MRHPSLPFLVLAVLVLAGPFTAYVQAQPAEATRRLPADSTVRAALRLGNSELRYTATAGSLAVAGPAQTAELSYVAYLAEPAAGKPPRPVTFVFGGGPGMSSAWLNLGGLGPRRFPFATGAASPSAPAEPVDNAESWLPFTDLVFLDPAGTGFSPNGEPAAALWGVRQDVEWTARFIQAWLLARDRLASPNYLVGESYGGFRAAELLHRLQTVEGIAMRGAVLISPILDFGLRGSERNGPMDAVLRLPAMAAAAAEHRSGTDADPAMLPGIERYATTEYLQDLLLGPNDDAAQARIAARVAGLTGLDPALVRQLGGRIDMATFLRTLHRDTGSVGSRYDAGASALDPFPSDAAPVLDDPIWEGATAPLTTAMVHHVRTVLGWRPAGAYRLFNRDASRAWEWPSRGLPDATGSLRKALALDRQLRVLIAHGATDLQCPPLMSRMVLDQMPRTLTADRIAIRVYAGGHFFYNRDKARAQLRDDARAMYEAR